VGLKGGGIVDHKMALAYTKANGYDGAEYLGLCEGFFCYAPFFAHPAGEGVPPTGLPSLILVDQNGDMRFSSPEETFRLGDKLKNQLEADFTARFGGRFFCSMPDGRYVYQRRGRDYLLEDSSASPEAVMKASLEQGKNLLITTFPAVDLYPDPDAVY
jgi:hypothetical protein